MSDVRGADGDGDRAPYPLPVRAPAGFVGFAFDPDDGKDQDGSHAIAWSAIHG
jgi:hypothetical protein